ncbi:MAG: acetyl-CoA C-acyltransferase [Porticoccaceae bacterium]|nr:MAG: acetyl-CoA C-acyltransferase [Porticoccaceae bacterium]
MSDPIVIVGMARTPIGSMQGQFTGVPTTELGAAAIKAAVERSGVAPEKIGSVDMGCCLTAGLRQAPARQAALGAGLPPSVGATTLNKVCGSGMKAAMNAWDSLTLGHVDVAVAGGMESMTNAPYLMLQGRGGYRFGDAKIHDHMTMDGLEDAYGGQAMGIFAEQCVDKYEFTREEQDAFAITSLERANKAIAEGKFEQEITPFTVKTRRGEVQYDTDEQPGKGNPEKIPKMRPAFKKDGTVTAANASSISDGAAALVMTRLSVAEEMGLKPLAKICAHTTNSHEPEWFTTAPVGAIQKLLKKVGWSKDEVDLYEINEAFAVVTMATMKELDLPHDKVNVHGGACALGHPIGASGARIIVTLLSAMQTYGKSKGVAGVCIGGGEATAVALELM